MKATPKVGGVPRSGEGDKSPLIFAKLLHEKNYKVIFGFGDGVAGGGGNIDCFIFRRTEFIRDRSSEEHVFDL
jgi:hypothetical protein